MTVDGCPATVGAQVDPRKSRVTLDGQRLDARPRRRYIALHKPAGFLSSCADPRGRKTVLDLVPTEDRLFPVGRLDLDSRGLLILTNDGALSQRLTHPRHGVSKEYRLRVRGHPRGEQLAVAISGVMEQGEVLRCDKIRVIRRTRDFSELRVTLREGKRRELRRLWHALGHPVLDLRRDAVGPVRLGRLPEGAYRELSPVEVAALKQAGTPHDYRH